MLREEEGIEVECDSERNSKEGGKEGEREGGDEVELRRDM